MKRKNIRVIEWCEGDIHYLRTHYEKETNDDMARHLGVSGATIGNKLRELGLSRPRCNPPHEWTDAELSYLREHYANEPRCDIAYHLHLSDGTVKKKAIEMGLKKSASFSTASYAGRYVRNYKHCERNVEQGVL